MNRIAAIIEREMRKFFRSPALMIVSLIFPLVQLVVLGNAFGGKIRDTRLGVVDEDGGQQAMQDVRNGKLNGAIIIPPQYSRRVYEKDGPRIALIVDNTDTFISSTLE